MFPGDHAMDLSRWIAGCVVAGLSLAGGCSPPGEYVPRNGDIVFQTSRSAQSAAIQRATHSRYSHMGIVVVKDGRAFVFEAVEVVKTTPLDRWIGRGEGSHFVAKRLAHADRILTEDALARMLAVGETFKGEPYDPWFEWSDDRIYCSELVWKIYDRGLHVQLGHPDTIPDFDRTDPIVRAGVRERWRNGPRPEEPVISPAAIFDSRLLVTVHAE